MKYDGNNIQNLNFETEYLHEEEPSTYVQRELQKYIRIVISRQCVNEAYKAAGNWQSLVAAAAALPSGCP